MTLPRTREQDLHEERRSALAARFRAVRRRTLSLAEPLSEEDCTVQSMAEASPVKWHLAHTSWFFETFVLVPGDERYSLFHPRYGFLFNSYYETVGERVERPRRGLQTRPPLAEVRAYRAHVERALEAWIESPAVARWPALLDVLELGLNHEEQHQELMLTDVKHLFSCGVLEPAYTPAAEAGPRGTPGALGFVPHEGGVVQVGHTGGGFAFDNEGPAHDVLLRPFELASRATTCGEFLEFVEAGGYEEPGWWLSDGVAFVRSQDLRAPFTWRREPGGWSVFTLHGRRPLDPDEPVTHLSFYEADAYARFRGARLPREEEWEALARRAGGPPDEGQFQEPGALHPRPQVPAPDGGLAGMFGGVWEWTASPYVAYPGFRPVAGALGEYNGKFMCNQLVLRGGSCATPRGHVRASYRNFFPPDARWQFSGIRLARDA